MADVTMNVVQALQAMTPASPQNSAQSSASPAESFSRVMSQRGNTPQNTQQSSKAPQDKAPGPQEAAQPEEEPAAAGTAIERLLAAMKADTSATEEEDPLAAVKALIEKLTKPADETDDDKSEALTTDTDAATLIATPVVVPDKLAAPAATVADTTATDDAALGQTSTKTRGTLDDALATIGREDNPHAAVQTPEGDNGFAAHAAQAAANQHAAAQAAQRADIPQHTVHTPVDNPAWAEDVGQKLVWTAHQDSGKASLVLTPPSLGRVEVSLNVNGDQATATFVAASHAARDALNDSMPRLREVLAQAGIHLGQADVSANQSGQQGQAQNAWQGSRATGGSNYAQGGAAMTEVGAVRSQMPVRGGNGLVDTFA